MSLRSIIPHYTNNEESSFFCHIIQSIPQDFHTFLLHQVGLSSDPGQGVIIAARDYERQFSAHLLDWAAFAVMTLPSLGIPFLLWWSSKSKYEAIMLKKAE